MNLSLPKAKCGHTFFTNELVSALNPSQFLGTIVEIRTTNKTLMRELGMGLKTNKKVIKRNTPIKVRRLQFTRFISCGGVRIGGIYQGT